MNTCNCAYLSRHQAGCLLSRQKEGPVLLESRAWVSSLCTFSLTHRRPCVVRTGKCDWDPEWCSVTNKWKMIEFPGFSQNLYFGFLWVPSRKLLAKSALEISAHRWLFLRLVEREFDRAYGTTSKGPGTISFVSLLLYNTLALLNLLKSNCWSWEDGSVGKVSAMLAWGPEFKSLAPM